MGVLNYEVMWYISGHVSFTEVKSKLHHMAKGHVEQQSYHIQGPERSKLNLMTNVSWCCRERALKTDKEEKKLLNKVLILVDFFAHKKYYCSFVKLNNF